MSRMRTVFLETGHLSPEKGRMCQKGAAQVCKLRRVCTEAQAKGAADNTWMKLETALLRTTNRLPFAAEAEAEAKGAMTASRRMLFTFDLMLAFKACRQQCM